MNHDDLRCDCTCIHQEIVNKVHKRMPSGESLSKLADLFKVMGDNTRVKILWALSESEMCVCDLAYLLNMTQSAISHQLRVLKQTGVVESRKEGKVVFYSLSDTQIKGVFKQGITYLETMI